MRAHHTKILILWFVVLLSACSDLDSASKTLDALEDDSVSFDDVFLTEDSTVSNDCLARDDPGGDADGDGVENQLEDANGNCVVDADETDPNNSDSDGDGLPDGEEDINRNGQVDNGELDPRSSDSDADGVLDGLEPLALVCESSMLTTLHTVTSSTLDVSLAFSVPVEFESLTPTLGVFNDAQRRLFGFVVREHLVDTDLDAGVEDSLLRMQRGADVGELLESDAFTTWGTPSFAPRQARRSKLAFGYGVDSLNAQFPRRDPARLRDALAVGLSDAIIDVDARGVSECGQVDVALLHVLRSDQTLVTVGMVACRDHLEDITELQAMVEDLCNSSSFAPASFSPNGYKCQQEHAQIGGAAMDLLVVIDNSASMSDERSQALAIGRVMVDTLRSVKSDWRLAVTTTEAYLLDEGGASLTHDEALDPCTGLRTEGFLMPEQVGLSTLFDDALGKDYGCDPQALYGLTSEIDLNLCGDHDERGLSSALSVLERLSSAKGSECVDAESIALREAATPVIVWISDEEDGAFVAEDGVTSLDPTDPVRAAQVADVVASLEERGARVCAFVAQQACVAPLSDELSEGATTGQAYLDVVEALEGVSGDLCGDRLQATIDACLSAASGISMQYAPLHPPILSSLRVAVDDALLPRSAERGWTFEPESGTIVLHGVELNEESRIAMGFLRWRSSID